MSKIAYTRDSPRSRITRTDVFKIIDAVIDGAQSTATAHQFGISQGHVSSIMYLRSWKHLEHPRSRIEKWRKWLSEPSQYTLKRSLKNRSQALAHFERNIKIEKEVCING